MLGDRGKHSIVSTRKLVQIYKIFFWFSIVSLKFQISDGSHFNLSLLQKCPKNDFFNLETLTSCHHIQHITLHKKIVFWQLLI